MRWILFLIAFAAVPALAQTTRPDAAPATTPSADQVLNQMLKSSDADKSTVLQPQQSAPLPDAAGSAGSAVGILREGTDVIDRVGRIQKSADGQQTQFIFDSDGRALHDAPLVILPNLKLMSMENAVSVASHDLRFRVTGTVTEYRGHNYILLEKVVVVQDRGQDF
jgi:hypothetical protein